MYLCVALDKSQILWVLYGGMKKKITVRDSTSHGHNLGKQNWDVNIEVHWTYHEFVLPWLQIKVVNISQRDDLHVCVGSYYFLNNAGVNTQHRIAKNLVVICDPLKRCWHILVVEHGIVVFLSDFSISRRYTHIYIMLSTVIKGKRKKCMSRIFESRKFRWNRQEVLLRIMNFSMNVSYFP